MIFQLFFIEQALSFPKNNEYRKMTLFLLI